MLLIYPLGFDIEALSYAHRQLRGEGISRVVGFPARVVAGDAELCPFATMLNH
jgi:hypothetical protein